MGRLFWKFFVFIWLAQLAGILGTGALFWVERQQFANHVPGIGERHHPGPPPHEFADHPPPPEFARGLPPPHGRPPGGPLPVLPMIVGLLASLLCAAGLAWYFAKPIRQLRNAFDAAANGNLDVRVTPGMGGRRDELADLGKDFDRMTAQLQSFIEGQQRLLHDVSHEMRSPLARLQAAIGLARQQPARIDDFLLRIEREGDRMDQLIGELLTLSRVEAGVTGELEAVDIGELLASIAEDARFEGSARQIAIAFTPGPSAEVSANAELLHRAIENVVRNAIGHSPDGGTVRLQASSPDDGALHITIADQGQGVPENELEAIFQPFFRGEGSTFGSGYGLGLAIARRAITASGGRIYARKMPGEGLAVEIELPLLSA
ncbi:ATP-binding protein [Dechloromonas denitrificans]|uniref:ATP-binding protein n=1 Tax=Dechloromonas denitrificans TaxID=281362 RepID=UPI001CFA0467|nr:ATP-binding protein [Dechloromonas denitrificans]UCV09046.1 HAMP domain-containing protein [Dechloromonas denitrificans]